MTTIQIWILRSVLQSDVTGLTRIPSPRRTVQVESNWIPRGIYYRVIRVAGAGSESAQNIASPKLFLVTVSDVAFYKTVTSALVTDDAASRATSRGYLAHCHPQRNVANCK